MTEIQNSKRALFGSLNIDPPEAEEFVWDLVLEICDFRKQSITIRV